MIPYGHQLIDKNDIDEVVKVLKSDWLTQGPNVLEFEKSLAVYCGAKYAVAVSSGTAALHLAYLAAGIGKDDEVITSPNTFAATANMLLAVGARPVFGDIDLNSYNLDEKEIEVLISKKTKAIVPVHFAGHSCQMDEIRRIAKKHDLVVIEDACHGLGAKYKDVKVGSCKYSDMAVFSFHPVKSIATGEGGAILTNNKKYYDKLVLLRSHGIRKNKQGKNVMNRLGYNYRMTDIQAVLGLSQLKKLDKFISQRQKIAKSYCNRLGDLNEVILPQESSENYSSWHIYVIRAKNRDKMAVYLKEKGIGVNFHYPAVYSHPYYQRIGYKGLKLKNMDEYQKTCLTIPCFVGLTKAQVGYITETIRMSEL